MHKTIQITPTADFIVILGDSVAGGNNSNALLSQLNDFRNIVASYYETKPLIPVLGNHELLKNYLANVMLILM